MGYRSDVAFEIHGPKDLLEFFQRTFEELFECNELKKSEILTGPLDRTKRQTLTQQPEDIYSLKWYCGWIKWNDIFPSSIKKYTDIVYQFHLLWDLADKYELPGVFIRIGEYVNDIEENAINNGYSDISLRIIRQIYFN